MSKHWTESLFAEKFAELYIATLEELIPRSIYKTTQDASTP